MSPILFFESQFFVVSRLPGKPFILIDSRFWKNIRHEQNPLFISSHDLQVVCMTALDDVSYVVVLGLNTYDQKLRENANSIGFFNLKPWSTKVLAFLVKVVWSVID